MNTYNTVLTRCLYSPWYAPVRRWEALLTEDGDPIAQFFGLTANRALSKAERALAKLRKQQQYELEATTVAMM